MTTLREFFTETKDALISRVLNQEPNTTVAPGLSAPAGETPAANLADLIYTAVGGTKDDFISAVTEKFRASGFGQKLIEETKQQELAAYLKDPTTWTVIIAALAILLFFGGLLGRRAFR